jgi:hypothetical protein
VVLLRQSDLTDLCIRLDSDVIDNVPEQIADVDRHVLDTAVGALRAP